jgi:hypothetical protein
MGTTKPRPKEVFEHARRRAFLRALFSFVSRRPDQLLSWDQVTQTLGLRGQEIGRRTESVPLDRIVGSVGRYQDFDRAFLPRHDALERRWLHVAKAQLSGANLPPVELYKVGEAYFVVDGHHRVSVARSLGLQFLDAKVIEIETSVPIDASLDAQELTVKGEHARFLEKTQLHKLRPDQRVEVSVSGGYERILAHIAVHSCLMEANQGDCLSHSEAVTAWYDEVYTPVVELIREHDILASFPQRTEADLYLWIVAHREHLRARCGDTISTESAVEHYAERYPAHPLQRAARAAQELVTGLDCDLLTQGDANDPTDHQP